MRRLVRIALLALALPLAPATSAAATSSPLDDVTGKLICDCGCNNLTVRNCTCGKADRIRTDVSARLSRGQTPEQIVRSYVDEYGEQILAAPTRRGFNLVGWAVPFLAVLSGAVLLLLMLRKWSRVPWTEAPLVQPLGSRPSSPPDPEFLRRVQEELDEVER